MVLPDFYQFVTTMLNTEVDVPLLAGAAGSCFREYQLNDPVYQLNDPEYQLNDPEYQLKAPEYQLEGSQIPAKCSYEPVRCCCLPTSTLCDVRYRHSVWCYIRLHAVSDTELAYAANRRKQCQAALGPAVSGSCLRASYAVSGTDTVAAYARPKRCPIREERIAEGYRFALGTVLRARYAMSGTDIAHGAARMCGTDIAYGATRMCGTDIAYGATRRRP
eukprot:1840010-Rhodomonas_salina.2